MSTGFRKITKIYFSALFYSSHFFVLPDTIPYIHRGNWNYSIWCEHLII